MNHNAEDSDEFFVKLTERLRKIRPNCHSPGESSPTKPFSHQDMILVMLSKAESRNRDFLGDIFRLISLYYFHGSNNTERILNQWNGSPQLKQQFSDMIDVYGIVNGARSSHPEPTLSRIADALPHVSLVLASEINVNPYLGLKLWVSDKDLGTRINYLFKLSCFPGLIYIDSSIKAQVCLLLFNLCYAKAISNIRTSDKNIISAFVSSCRFSTNIMEQKLAPLESRIRFTEYIETIPLSAELFNRVWISVFGDLKIPLTEVTAVTLFHEKVLRSQPLYLISWKELLKEKHVS